MYCTLAPEDYYIYQRMREETPQKLNRAPLSILFYPLAGRHLSRPYLKHLETHTKTIYIDKKHERHTIEGSFSDGRLNITRRTLVTEVVAFIYWSATPTHSRWREEAGGAWPYVHTITPPDGLNYFTLPANSMHAKIKVPKNNFFCYEFKWGDASSSQTSNEEKTHIMLHTSLEEELIVKLN